MTYLEQLPPNCPPANKASEQTIDGAYRIVSSMNPTIADFYSNARLGIPLRPTMDPCRHASCSLFISRDMAIDIAGKLPKTRIADPHISLCSIDTFDGQCYINKKKHIDLWAYDNFDPSTVVVMTEKV